MTTATDHEQAPEMAAGRLPAEPAPHNHLDHDHDEAVRDQGTTTTGTGPSQVQLLQLETRSTEERDRWHEHRQLRRELADWTPDCPKFWIPEGVARWWAWFSILAGWVLTSLVLAALTGILKRD